MLEITGTTEYFDKIQNNRYSEDRSHIENLFRRFDYSHHQEMNDDDITYTYNYIVK